MSKALIELLSINKDAVYVRGCYLVPSLTFVYCSPEESEKLMEIIGVVEYSEHKIFITRMGGLFTELPSNLRNHTPPYDVATFSNLVRFNEEIASIFNLIVCEITMNTHLSPKIITPGLLGGGRMKDGFAILTSGGGAWGGDLLRNTSDIARKTYLPSNRLSDDVIVKVGSLNIALKLSLQISAIFSI